MLSVQVHRNLLVVAQLGQVLESFLEVARKFPVEELLGQVHQSSPSEEVARNLQGFQLQLAEGAEVEVVALRHPYHPLPEDLLLSLLLQINSWGEADASVFAGKKGSQGQNNRVLHY